MTTANEQADSPESLPGQPQIESPERQNDLRGRRVPRTLEDLMAADDQQNRELMEIRKELTALRSELPRLATREQILADLHNRHQALADRFHEREVLIPIVRQLIGIADRCRQNEEALVAHLAKAADDGRLLRSRYLEFLLESRRADRIEIENILANFAVEPFEAPEEVFNSALQTCVTRVPTSVPHLVGRIANRLRPGYRRNGQVVRPECVAVYVASPSGVQDKESAHASC